MSKISPMQAAALGLIPSPTTVSSTAPKPVAATAAIKAKVVKAKVAKPDSLKPASSKPVAAKTVVTTKPAVKTVSKTAVKPVAKNAIKTALKPAPKATRNVGMKLDHKKSDHHKDHQKNTNKKDDKKDDKKIRPEKVKMERDSFTMPKDEYAQLTLLKARLMAMGQPAKKSELLRAGIKLLAAMSDNTLKTTMAKIPVIKTGRPNK
ncbi:MAG: hypothetical protein H7Z20_06620 [Bdellovibrio sp.]|nr:hypothetical protein [Methylotenera sp.]